MSASSSPILLLLFGAAIVAKLYELLTKRVGGESSTTDSALDLAGQITSTLLGDDDEPPAEAAVDHDRPPIDDLWDERLEPALAPQTVITAQRSEPNRAPPAQRAAVAAIYRTIYGPGLCSPR